MPVTGDLQRATGECIGNRQNVDCAAGCSELLFSCSGLRWIDATLARHIACGVTLLHDGDRALRGLADAGAGQCADDFL
jgi:hypothetical protein